jgi:Vacuolar-sorting-associated 13 protein C-terminal
LDLVGNPLALVQSLGTGVKDFFYEPAHALITNPNDIRKFGRSFLKGTISIVSNTTDGMIGTGTTITRSIGRNVAKLTMDAAFLRTREDLQV